jgi:hypothetical protein
VNRQECRARPMDSIHILAPLMKEFSGRRAQVFAEIGRPAVWASAADSFAWSCFTLHLKDQRIRSALKVGLNGRTSNLRNGIHIMVDVDEALKGGE